MLRLVVLVAALIAIGSCASSQPADTSKTQEATAKADKASTAASGDPAADPLAAAGATDTAPTDSAADAPGGVTPQETPPRQPGKPAKRVPDTLKQTSTDKPLVTIGATPTKVRQPLAERFDPPKPPRRTRKPPSIYPVPLLKDPAAMSPPRPDTTMRVHFVDVGQGQAVLVEFACGAILIDTGGEEDDYHEFYGDHELRRYLAAFFKRRKDLNKTLDALVLTHPHKDHVRGVEDLIPNKRVKFKNIITNGQLKGSGLEGQLLAHQYAEDHDDVALRTIATDDIYGGGITDKIIDPIACKSGDPVIHALWGELKFNPGWKKHAFRNENNHSIVMRIVYGKSSIIFMGDLEEEGIEEFLRMHSPEEIASDVWQIGHHGADNGTTEPLAYAIEPEIAVLPMGNSKRKNTFSAYRHGHPRISAIERILPYVKRDRKPVEVPMAEGSKRFEDTRLDKAIYGTGWGGTIIIDFELDGTVTVINEPRTKT